MRKIKRAKWRSIENENGMQEWKSLKSNGNEFFDSWKPSKSLSHLQTWKSEVDFLAFFSLIFNFTFAHFATVSSQVEGLKMEHRNEPRFFFKSKFPFYWFSHSKLCSTPEKLEASQESRKIFKKWWNFLIHFSHLLAWLVLFFFIFFFVFFNLLWGGFFSTSENEKWKRKIVEFKSKPRIKNHFSFPHFFTRFNTARKLFPNSNIFFFISFFQQRNNSDSFGSSIFDIQSSSSSFLCVLTPTRHIYPSTSSLVNSFAFTNISHTVYWIFISYNLERDIRHGNDETMKRWKTNWAGWMELWSVCAPLFSWHEEMRFDGCWMLLRFSNNIVVISTVTKWNEQNSGTWNFEISSRLILKCSHFPLFIRPWELIKQQQSF